MLNHFCKSPLWECTRAKSPPTSSFATPGW